MKRLCLTVVLLAAMSAGWSAPAQPTAEPPAPAPQTARYFCPMKCEGEKTYDQPGRCPVCKMKLKPVPAPPTGLSMEIVKAPSKPPEPGKKAEFSLQLKASDESVLKTVQGARVDVFVASQDLGWLAHERAAVAPRGTADVGVAFPHAGRFFFFADLGAGRPKIAPLEYVVPGGPPTDRPFTPDAGSKQIEDGYEVRVATPARLKANQPSTLSFAITLNGAALKSLGRPLNERVRLVLISQDKAAFLVVPAVGADGKDAPQTAGPRGTGDLSFELTPPAPGLYAAWLEFEHGEKSHLARFVLEATP